MKEKIALFQNLLYVSEAIALVAGLVSWKFIRDSRVKRFVGYLVFIVLFEQLASYLARHGHGDQSTMIYNYLVVPVEFLFCYWFLSRHIAHHTGEMLWIIFSLLSIVARIVEFTFLKDQRFFFFSLSYVLSSLFLLVILLIFIQQFIRSEKILRYDRYFVFWTAIGLLIYYLGSFPLYAFYNYLYKADKSSFYIYWEIQMCLNMLMYLLFATGLIWTNIKYRSSLP